MTDLSNDGRITVLYDQLGCGRSDHLASAPTDFWQMSLFQRELNHLVDHLQMRDRYAVLGQSCGGMLAMEHALEQPHGLQALVIADSMPSFPLWVAEADRLRLELPPEVEATLRRHEANATTDDPEYIGATKVFYDRHLCRVPWPECLVRGQAAMDADLTVYHAMNGPSEFHVIGNLKDWDIIDRLGEITVPCLLVSGLYDEATPAIQEVLLAGLVNARWALFQNSSHLPHIEEPEAWLDQVGGFLRDIDATHP
jgi:L-proline amide hydrolase